MYENTLSPLVHNDTTKKKKTEKIRERCWEDREKKHSKISMVMKVGTWDFFLLSFVYG